MDPTPLAHHSSRFQGKLQGTQGPTPSASETGARASSQMSMEIHDKKQDSASALTDPTEKVLNSEYSEFYLSTVIFHFSFLREEKRGRIAGLIGIKDRTRIVQEAELFMVAARHVALKRPPHGALRFSRTRVQGFSGIPALEMSVNSSGSTQN